MPAARRCSVMAKMAATTIGLYNRTPLHNGFGYLSPSTFDQKINDSKN